MFSLNQIELQILELKGHSFIHFLMENRLICREMTCPFGYHSMDFVIYKRNKDGYAWRCMHKKCIGYKKYHSIRKKSFFEDFTIEIKTILRIILRYLSKHPQHIIVNFFGNERTVRRIIKKFNSLIPLIDFQNNKLGGPGYIVQIDETMMNYKCKSHRGRSPTNKSDALCILEYRDKIIRVFGTIIPDKKASTIIPIIQRQVAYGSIVWTDEHPSYKSLSSYGYHHYTVCHKYEFINHINGVNTQAIESFHNILKIWIKMQKGVKTPNRQTFLNTFCFFYNNRNNTVDIGLELIKI